MQPDYENISTSHQNCGRGASVLAASVRESHGAGKRKRCATAHRTRWEKPSAWRPPLLAYHPSLYPLVEVRWYLNGTLDGRHPIPKTMTGGLHAAGRDIAFPSTHKLFRELIGDFRIYRQAFDAERVRELLQEQTPPLDRARGSQNE